MGEPRNGSCHTYIHTSHTTLATGLGWPLRKRRFDGSLEARQLSASSQAQMLRAACALAGGRVGHVCGREHCV